MKWMEPKCTATCSTQAERFVYDYFIKDHLGNTRAVLTEQQESICYPGATLETSTLPAEKQLFTIEDARIRDKSVVNGASSYAQFQDKLYQVHGGLTNQKTGLGIVLKVMAGDKVKFNVQSIYTLPSGGNTGSPLTLGLTDLLSSLAGSSFSGGKAITQNILETLNPIGTFSTFNSKRSGTTTRPQAYLNYMCFNEQFEFTGDGDVAPVGAGSGTTPVYTQINKFVNDEVLINKNGYIYIFVSNESNLPVFFDNLMVTHTPGPIVEETHYYPFGLTMAGISSRAMGKTPNRYKFNDGTELENKEFSDGSGLELYSTDFRSYDLQIGRFHQIDPLTEYDFEWSPYVYALNNPLLLNDPLGLTADSTVKPVVDDPFKDVKPMAEVIVTAKKNNSVGQPGFIESLMPVWGSGRAAIDDFQNGRWGWGIFNTAMVAVDVATLGIGSSLIKGATKTIVRAGVYEITVTAGGQYIGQSKNFFKRLIQHFGKGGKLSMHQLDKVLLHKMHGSTKLEREVYEQYLIDKNGLQNLINGVNPMGGRRELYEQMIDGVIEKFGLPK